ncbi:MAG: A24 family peptidase [Pseudomonadota bacterium]
MNAETFALAVVLPVVVLVLALVFGPLPIVVRALMRRPLGPAKMRRWMRPASLGVGVGMVLAALLIAALDPGRTLNLVMVCLLLLLAIIDWQWRWLPIEWTLGLIVLGVVHGIVEQELLLAIQQMLIPALTVLATRQVLLAVLKKDALGLGDVWLIAGLGAFLPLTASFLMVGLAALTGLAEVLLRRGLAGNTQKTIIVSYGTHLCAVFLILRSFPQVN